MLTVLAVLTALIWLPVLLHHLARRGFVVLIFWLFLAPVAVNLVDYPGTNPFFGPSAERPGRHENSYLTDPTASISASELLDPTRSVFLAFMVMLHLNVLLTRQRLTPLDRTEYWMVIFSLLLLASALFRSWRLANALQTATDAFIVPFLGYYIMRRLVTTETRFLQLTKAVGYMGGYLIVIALIERGLHPELVYRLQGPFGHRDFLYIAMLMAFGMIGLELTRHSGNLQVRWAIPPRICKFVLYGAPVIVLLTLTRGLWLGFFFGMWVSALLGYRLLPVSQRLRLISLILLLIPIVLLSVPALTPSQLVEERIEQGGTIRGRLTTWQIAIRAGLEQPLLGIGLNDLRHVLGAAALQLWRLDFRILTTSHNSYLSILVELGVVGFLAYLMLIISLIRTGVRLYRMGPTIQDRWRGVAILGILTAHFIPPCFSTVLYNGVVSHVYVFACIGAIAGLSPARSPHHEQSGPVPLHPQVALAQLER